MPRYNPGRLRKAIEADMASAQGFIGAWRDIIGILRRQKTNPPYQMVYELPIPAPG